MLPYGLVDFKHNGSPLDLQIQQACQSLEFEYQAISSFKEFSKHKTHFLYFGGQFADLDIFLFKSSNQMVQLKPLRFSVRHATLGLAVSLASPRSPSISLDLPG